MYALAGVGHLDEWLDAHARHPSRQAVIEFVFRLMDDPLDVGATLVPRPGKLPAYTVVVPGTDVQLEYVVYRKPPYHVAAVSLLPIRG